MGVSLQLGCTPADSAVKHMSFIELRNDNDELNGRARYFAVNDEKGIGFSMDVGSDKSAEAAPRVNFALAGVSP